MSPQCLSTYHNAVSRSIIMISHQFSHHITTLVFYIIMSIHRHMRDIILRLNLYVMWYQFQWKIKGRLGVHNKTVCTMGAYQVSLTKWNHQVTSQGRSVSQVCIQPHGINMGLSGYTQIEASYPQGLDPRFVRASPSDSGPTPKTFAHRCTHELYNTHDPQNNAKRLTLFAKT